MTLLVSNGTQLFSSIKDQELGATEELIMSRITIFFLDFQQKYNKIKLQLHDTFNMKQKIDNQIRNIMSNEKDKEKSTRTCNCPDKISCFLKGKCQSCVQSYSNTNRTYKKKKKHSDIYIALTENHFKTRCSLHNFSFKLPFRG